MRDPFIPIDLPPGFEHTFTTVGDVTLHAIEGGQGPTLLLLGGWPQTCYVWRLLWQQLGEKFRVISLDMRGQGDSDIPAGPYDCGTAAQEIKDFLALKQINQFYLVGHDVGAWVAFTVLKTFPESILGAGLIDAAIPGLVSPDFFGVVNAAKVWQFYFHKVPDLADSLVAGKELEYLSWYFTNKSKRKQNLTPEVMDYYAKYYSQPGAMKAGFLWYAALEETMAANTLAPETKFTQPIFAMGGEFATKTLIYNGMTPYCENLTSYLIEQCGHYIPEEAPEEIFQAISDTFSV
ncbi:alpha/beta fold hydrolase [Synechococcus sp. PCC 6312]|uniref:alpha/beta fold hydrolase n=1 Tax=Synechococcus sp. (strain ATCC 27167 / PCC 6312) TaxID=195253 RepID=UPI00029F1D02|nr:alpha/beta hydrolase [Synechococcus sp. PCC 6312]AFY61241.1 putative hydrolase or acyltransferase of alpha/beta superfamily [Synechococcus sp. PCC 6312]